MTPWVASIGPDATVQDAARRMLEHAVSALPVVDDSGRMVGIVSEGDLLRRREIGTDVARAWWLRLLSGESAAADLLKTHGKRVGDVMTAPAVSVTESASLGKIALLLENHRIKRVPVLRAGRLVGIVSRADLVRQVAIAPPGKRPASRHDRSLRQRLVKRLQQTGGDPACLNVSISRGVLHLWGGIASEAQRQALRAAADGVPGVRRIEDHTFVMPPRHAGGIGL